MIKSESYECPVCKTHWETREQAITCRNKHRIMIVRWVYCEICGAGWNPDRYGDVQAAKLARECEQKHRDKGEEKRVARDTYFLSRGKMGRYYGPGE